MFFPSWSLLDLLISMNMSIFSKIEKRLCVCVCVCVLHGGGEEEREKHVPHYMFREKVIDD